MVKTNQSKSRRPTRPIGSVISNTPPATAPKRGRPAMAINAVILTVKVNTKMTKALDKKIESLTAKKEKINADLAAAKEAKKAAKAAEKEKAKPAAKAAAKPAKAAKVEKPTKSDKKADKKKADKKEKKKDKKDKKKDKKSKKY